MSSSCRHFPLSPALSLPHPPFPGQGGLWLRLNPDACVSEEGVVIKKKKKLVNEELDESVNARAQLKGFWKLSLEGTFWVWRQVLLILFSCRAPECAPLKSKMIYASSKDAIKKKLTGKGEHWWCHMPLCSGLGCWVG